MFQRTALGALLVSALFAVGCATVLGLDEDRELRAGAGAGSGGDGGGDGGAGGAPAAYDALVIADAPLAYFRFEEASGPFVDSMDPARSMTVTGTVERGVPAAVGVGVRFDGGAGRLLLGASDFGFVGTVAMTVEAWALTTAPADFQDIVGKLELDAPNDTGYALRFRPGSRYGWFFSRTNPTGSRNMSFYSAPEVLTHLVITFDGTASVLYVNGAEQDRQDDASDIALPQTPAPFRAGGLETGNAFTGVLDELAIYDRALPADRVAAHFQARQP